MEFNYDHFRRQYVPFLFTQYCPFTCLVLLVLRASSNVWMHDIYNFYTRKRFVAVELWPPFFSRQKCSSSMVDFLYLKYQVSSQQIQSLLHIQQNRCYCSFGPLFENVKNRTTFRLKFNQRPFQYWQRYNKIENFGYKTQCANSFWLAIRDTEKRVSGKIKTKKSLPDHNGLFNKQFA